MSVRPAMSFRYECPDRIDTAAALAAEGGRILAGGQSLMPLLKRGSEQVETLVDINRIAGLDRIEWQGDRLRIGALARLESVRCDALVRRHLPLLAAALASVANPAVRRRGTLVGNLVQNGPGTEAPAVLALHRPEAELADGRCLPFADRPAGSFVTAVWLAVSPAGSRAAFIELQKRYGHLCGLGCGIERAPGGALRVTLAGLAETPVFGPALDAAVADGADDDGLRAAATALLAGRPIRSDIHADAAWRRAALPPLLRRTLHAVHEERPESS